MNAKIKKIIALGTGAVIASVGAAVVIVSTSNNKNLSMRHAKAAPMELVTSRASGLADDDLTCFDGGKDMVAFDYKITLTNNKEQYIHNNGSKLVLKNRNDIKKIEVTNTKLTSLEIVGCDSLHDVFAGNNQISDIHIEGCHQLYELDLNHNALSLLKINGLSNLHNLHIDWNKITQLDVTNLYALDVLWAGTNKITTLNLSNTYNLGLIHIDSNNIKNLDLSHCNRLYEVYYDNKTIMTWPSHWDTKREIKIMTNDGKTEWPVTNKILNKK